MYICILDIKYTSNIHDVMSKLYPIQYICQMYNMHISSLECITCRTSGVQAYNPGMLANPNP